MPWFLPLPGDGPEDVEAENLSPSKLLLDTVFHHNKDCTSMPGRGPLGTKGNSVSNVLFECNPPLMQFL